MPLKSVLASTTRSSASVTSERFTASAAASPWA
jgi:hypothetical protein